MTHDYLGRPAPKSCGREEFGAGYVARLLIESKRRHLSIDTLISTATSFTARTIAEAVKKLNMTPDEVIAAGGGIHNSELMKRLGAELQQVTGRTIPVTTTADHGLDPDAKEAVAFALLANESLHGGAGNLPSVTGARHAAVLGSFTPGTNR